MAIFEVKVPQLSESVAEATLLQWKKKVGDAVGQDEILIEIETDKVVLEVPAPSAGVLTEILVADGGTVVAEQLIAKIDSTAVATAAPAAAAPDAVAAPAAAKAATYEARRLLLFAIPISFFVGLNKSLIARRQKTTAIT
jgi:2-oxoglutarate dehydrogenase E2 component (dihydrolipoamide succinyltransferase)